MTNMRTPFLLAALASVLMSLPADGQDPQTPGDILFTTKEDYAKYEPDIIRGARWLESNPLGQQVEKRAEVSRFLLRWLTGSPTVSIELNPFVKDLTSKNPDFLIVFMAGYARWVLENQYSGDRIKAFTAGTKSVLNLFTLGGDVKNNKWILKAQEADSQAKLEDWVKENMDKK
jgi:hypothetical protein